MSDTEGRKWTWVFPMVIVMLNACSQMQAVKGACRPRQGCSRALAYYTLVQGDTLNVLAARFQTDLQDVQFYNNLADINLVQAGQHVYFPFPCECVDDQLGHRFLYEVQEDDKVNTIASRVFDYLTTESGIAAASHLDNVSLIYPGQNLNIPVNCSCGDSSVTPLYGLFVTYPAQVSDNISYLAGIFGTSENYVRAYNPSVNFNNSLSLGEILYFPSSELSTGRYPPYNLSDASSPSTNHSLIVGVSIGGALAVLLLIMLLLCIFCIYKRSRRREKHGLDEVVPLEGGYASTPGSRGSGMKFSSGEAGLGSGPSALSDFTVDKSVEFSFEELAAATNNFSVANKIGEGGYGAVYYAEIRGQKLAVKRMNLQATREFLAELQVLTHVHHTNLVQLIGYCTVDSLFLIYEFVENGTLDRHLHGKQDLPTLSWASRVQIALDSARGLEYIHEHTKPTYIHRDVKSSNILIDRQYHAKVADFGLTKLTESGVGSTSLTMPTRLVGTFGYMSPEYARYGDVSPKVDVYSFGVVLFEIISAKEAIVRTSVTASESGTPHREEQRGLVTLFEDVLKDTGGRDKLSPLVDPALGTNYPLESAWKMAQLAGACTQENPELRPNMRTAVVALMTLSSTTQDWELSAYGSDRIMTGLMSGR